MKQLSVWFPSVISIGVVVAGFLADLAAIRWVKCALLEISYADMT